jgi:hypothetical protein
MFLFRLYGDLIVNSVVLKIYLRWFIVSEIEWHYFYKVIFLVF